MRRRRTLIIVIPIAVLLGLVAVFTLAGTLAERSATGGGTSSQDSGPGKASDDLQQRSLSGDGTDSAAMLGETVAGPAGDQSSGATDMVAAIPDASSPSAHHLVRNGWLAVKVPRGTLLRSVNRVTALTAGMNGYVVSSSVGSEPQPWPMRTEPGDGVVSSDQPMTSSGDGYAGIVVRVPERQFDAALRRYAALGEVSSISTSSEDVTTQYVDLQARLDHHRAVERRLVRFLAATGSVPQMLAVQDRLDKVQLTIERLTAELKALREISSYGTITVTLTEKGRPQAVAAGASFWDTFRHSLQILGHGARLTALALVAVAPFVVVFGGLALIAWYAARRIRRRRRAEPPSLAA